MNAHDLAKKIHSALPSVRQWVERIIENNLMDAVPVSALGFSLLGSVFPHDLLTRTKVVIVNGRIPFPPLARMGLPELAQMEQMALTMAGITYRDIFFVRRNDLSESICFHEMVHVIQWKQLGIDNFLLAYGTGIIQAGYRNSPLEQMAYRLQEGFDRCNLPAGVVDLIQRETENIWAGMAPLFSSV